jgi:hypothetical protein
MEVLAYATFKGIFSIELVKLVLHDTFLYGSLRMSICQFTFYLSCNILSFQLVTTKVCWKDIIYENAEIWKCPTNRSLYFKDVNMGARPERIGMKSRSIDYDNIGDKCDGIRVFANGLYAFDFMFVSSE